MGLNGLEPSTSRLSGVRSNLLSYKPISTDFSSVHLALFEHFLVLFFLIESGGHLFSRTVSRQVSSAA